MKAQEIREMSEQELDNKKGDLEDQVFKLRFQESLGQLEDVKKIKNIKKDLARINTILTEKKRGNKENE
ncbi:MAG: 50S ribosomal protein L29 [Candidatus Aminicenantes bacterium]|nr:50S ribosomal protein L29 [Candidatus Aminicenantes bacterium]HHF52504.1 50S ribosomal protein L29 [Candidatus Aminicenantes bacterium]